jgi:hypothetical protein
MYPTGKDFLKDLLKHKEFYELKSDPERNFKDPPDAHELNLGQYLKVQSHQLFGKNFMSPNTTYRSLHLSHATGTGKCHGAGTKILMYDGTIKSVEDIVTGDKLMGPDNLPRYVRSTCTGTDDMYRVTSSCGESFVCNIAHMLTLRGPNGSAYNISLSECIDYNECNNEIPGVLLKMPVNWDPIETKLDAITAARHIIEYKQSIPQIYRCNGRFFLRRFLSTIINSIGVQHACGAKLKPSDHLETIIPDLKYIARSLGLDIRKFSNSWVVIGDLDILTCTRSYNSVINLDTSWSYESIGVGTYYGFTLTGDGRYMLDSFIVTHNTLAAVVISQEFIKSYRKIYDLKMSRTGYSRRSQLEADRDTPSVYVLGFGGTKAAFIRDLLSHPEFGFVTVSESEELLRRQKQAVSGLPDDIKAAKEYFSWLKKRITQKSKDGFYKFYGYDEFVNRLFPTTNLDITDLELEAERSLRTEHPTTLGELVSKHIEDGTIQVNEQFLTQFEGSLIIGDEIHNTYNMNMKNKRGVAIQYVLDHISTCKFVSLSATPINNSPTEIIELANYHLPTDQKITKKEFFVNNRVIKPGMLEKLSLMLHGKWSFLQDTNLKYFPKRTIVGNKVKLRQPVSELSVGEYIPYLNFIECEMSDLHQQTYDQFIKEQLDERMEDDIDDPDYDQENALEAASSGTAIPADGYTIYDMAFPSPDGTGIFKSSEVRNKLLSAPDSWKSSVGIEVKKKSSSDYVISGPFLLRENIGKYNSKLAKTLEIIEDTLKIQGKKLESGTSIDAIGEKMVIYHNRVKMSGVLQIHECLMINGYLDDTSEPTDNTYCLCGVRLGEHAKVKPVHDFTPIRILLAHSDMDKSVMDSNITKFNSINNTHGMQSLIFIGSKIIKESYDFKAVRRELILSLPINIPTLEQVIGRVVRKKSHAALEESERTADIMILLTVSQHADQNSPEMQKYAEKLLDYKVIQTILRSLNAGAIDADIHRDTIMTDEIKKVYFPNGPNSKPIDTLGNLYFDPDVTVSYKPEDLTLSTFNAYGYWNDEVKTITFILKQLFMIQPVWTYEDLFESVKQPPIGIEVNPKLFVEGNFLIALNSLLRETPTINLVGGTTASTLIERMFDPMDRIIIVDGAQYVVTNVGKYYVRTPIIALVSNPMNWSAPDTIEVWKKTYVGNKQMILLDAETYHRHLGSNKSVVVPASAFSKANTEASYITVLDNLLTETNINVLLALSETTQIKLVEDAIITLLGKTKNKYMSLYKRIIEFMDSLGVIVNIKTVSKYKDTIKLFKNGLSGLPELPVGYCNSKSVRLYDSGAKKWIEVSRVSLNKQANFKENDAVIGHLESAPSGEIKFKLRRPIQQIRETIREDITNRQQDVERSGINRAVSGDTRLIERGIVCETKPKGTLIGTLRQLGVRDNPKLNLNKMKIKQLCKMIKSRLLELEIIERTNKTRVKYLYGWWDEQISIASQV